MWAILAIGAYLLLALNGVTDKFLLTKSVKHPIAYAFYVGITGPLTLVLSVFGIIGQWLHWNFLQTEFVFQWLTVGQTFVAIIGGASFPIALYFSYKAIQQTSISRMLPIQGGLVPIFTLFLAYIILGERLAETQIFAFFFLVVGAVLISFKKKHGEWHALAFGNAAIASFLFALSLTLQKYVFGHVNFASGLIWTRMGFFVASSSFLLSKQSRKYIFNTPKEVSTGNKFVYLAARVSGGVSGFLQNYAIKIGSVTLVNALQGTQYVFLLALTTLLSIKFPKILKEHLSGQSFVQKFISIILVSVGLVLLVL
jgi:drug/metabolite transporter (DMT)-like permease